MLRGTVLDVAGGRVQDHIACRSLVVTMGRGGIGPCDDIGSKSLCRQDRVVMAPMRCRAQH